TTHGTGLFDASGGIELTDNGANGSLSTYDASSGTNIAIITYDLQATATVTPATAITNTAAITHYADEESGQNFATAADTDAAIVTTAAPTVTKVVASTNEGSTSGNNVAIGEQVTYTVTVRVPEGVMHNATLTDSMPAGLALVNINSLAGSAG